MKLNKIINWLDRNYSLISLETGSIAALAFLFMKRADLAAVSAALFMLLAYKKDRYDLKRFVNVESTVMEPNPFA